MKEFLRAVLLMTAFSISVWLPLGAEETPVPDTVPDPADPLSIGIRQDLVYHRVLGSRGETFFTGEYLFGSGVLFQTGCNLDNNSSQLSGYHLGVVSPTFFNWFTGTFLVVDRVFPEYGRGYLSYLLNLNFESRLLGRNPEKMQLLFLATLGLNSHNARSVEEKLYSILPEGTDYSNLNWVYLLELRYRIPRLRSEMALGVRNFSRQEASFTADYTTYITLEWNASRRVSLILETGQSPAGNFFLSGTWHTFYLSGGVHICY